MDADVIFYKVSNKTQEITDTFTKYSLILYGALPRKLNNWSVNYNIKFHLG